MFTSRGDEQKDIFKTPRDRERFYEYLLCQCQDPSDQITDTQNSAIA